MCVVTRETKPEEALIRFVLSPDNRVVADLKRQLPGRGVWVSCSRATLKKAIEKKMFARGFKAAVQVPDGFDEQVSHLLRQAALGTLGLGRRAGVVVSGYAKVEAALRSGDAKMLFGAEDGAEDGRRKLAALAEKLGLGTGDRRVYTCFTSAELCLALGAENVIHVAVTDERHAEAIGARCNRLMRFEAADEKSR